MMSKRIRCRNENIDFSRIYSLSEALALLKERSSVKFDETIEAIFSCAIDPRKGDQNIRGMVSLPKGSGKKMRIAVFAQGEQAQQALAAGADYIGESDLIEEVLKGTTDFDVCIATPSMMSQLSKLGKILGPKGLMPNPKLGTVTMDVKEAVTRARQGQASLRADKAGIVHTIMGKVSFSIEDLEENFHALHAGLLDLTPQGIKGNLIKKAFISSTMGFALSIDVTKLLS